MRYIQMSSSEAQNLDIIHKKSCYNSHTQFAVKVLYVIFIVIWIIVVVTLKLYTSPAWFILLIPIFTFTFAIFSTHNITYEMEDEMFKASYLSVGLILALPLLSWMNKDFSGDKDHFVSVIFLALGFTILTYIDVWVTKRWLSVFKHFRSCLQTMAVSLFLYAITTYYMNRPGGSLP